MKVGIVGSRDFRDLALVREYVRSLPSYAILLSGGARGVDTAAETAARERGFVTVIYRPVEVDGGFIVQKTVARPDRAWTENLTELRGKRFKELAVMTFPTFAQAAFYRNGLIVRGADRLIAFWDGLSRGTHDSILKAEEAGKPVEVYEV